MSVATGIAEEQITTDLARIAAITRTPEAEFENLGSAIVDLGNKMAGSETEIIELTQRLAGALSTVGVSTQDILGIASALTALGVNAEAGGTAVSKFFTEMVAATTGAGQASDANAKKLREQQDRITDLSASLETARARMQQFGRNTPASQVEATTAQIAKYERELSQARADMVKLQSASAGAGGRLEKFAGVAGLTIDQFKNLVQTDPSQAFVRIIEGIARIKAAEGPAAALSALEDIGIDDSRMRDALLRLAQGSDVLEKALDVSNTAWGENKALQEEAGRATQTTAVQWQLLVNTLQEEFLKVWDTVRQDVLEVMGIFRTQVIPRIQEIVKAFQELSPETRKQIETFFGLAASIGPVIFGLGIVAGILSGLLTPVGLVATAIGILAAAWITNAGDIQGKVLPVLKKIQTAFEFIKALLEPLGPIIGQAFETIGPILKQVADVVGPVLGKAFEIAVEHLKLLMGLLGRFVSFNVTIWGLVASIVERVAREIGAFFEQHIRPKLEAFGQWINDNVLQPLLGFLRIMAGLFETLGLPGLGDIGGAIRGAELALQQQAAGIRAGGPGAATNNVEVTINNPSVPDQTAAEAFAAQVQNAVLNAMIAAERQSEAPPILGVPGQTFIAST
jgi:hypothetical protein